MALMQMPSNCMSGSTGQGIKASKAAFSFEYLKYALQKQNKNLNKKICEEAKCLQKIGVLWRV